MSHEELLYSSKANSSNSKQLFMDDLVFRKTMNGTNIPWAVFPNVYGELDNLVDMRNLHMVVYLLIQVQYYLSMNMIRNEMHSDRM